MKTALLSILSFAVVTSLPAALPGADMLGKVISKHFDTSSDGKLDLGEWQSGLDAGFDHIDRSGDGSITATELDGLSSDLEGEVGSIGGPIVTALVKQMILSLDKDKDGNVSRKEFTGLGESVFQKMDADKNNELTDAELAELPTKLVLG